MPTVEGALRVLGLIALLPRSFPKGLETEVAERVAAVGRRTPARIAGGAALSDPSVLILDEATSNLDPGTGRVERALDRLMEGRTTVVSRHRLSTAARGRPHRRGLRRPARRLVSTTNLRGP